jgi:beta-lactamase class A
MAHIYVRWLAILVGRLGLTVSQAKEEYVKTLKLRQTRDSRQLERFLKQVVLKYTGNSETLMFERDTPTAHCHT